MSSTQSMTSTPKPHPSVDFVGSDFEALASHMQHCERTRDPLFGLKSGLQVVRSLVAGRLVTAACVAVLVAIAALALA